MKKLYILLLFMVCAGYAQQQPFITTWEVTANDLQISLPLYGAQNTSLNYTVDFGDGTVLYNQTNSVWHEYMQAGIYTVIISGTVPQISFEDAPAHASKLRTVEQWGDISWKSMSGAFRSCNNLTIAATDAPDLSQVTEMNRMFQGCSSLNQSINHWDVSNVTNMASMFSNATIFNQPLNNWDVSNVISMSFMFNSTAYNQPLNNWNVSNVIEMNFMFYGCTQFNQPLNSWNVSNVTTMEAMLERCLVFNQPLNNWNVSNVTNMEYMFSQCVNFNQYIGNWNVSNVTNMRHMFSYAYLFNQPIQNWDVSNVTNLSKMFWTASNFNQPIGSWSVSNVTDMNDMFASTQAFNQPLNNWDVANVTNMQNMFSGSASFNQPLNNWNISENANMSHMFSYAVAFNQDISDWNFVTPASIQYIISGSNLDEHNYDLFLQKMAQSGFEDITFNGDNLKYCDVYVHDFLVAELGWIINDEGLSDNCNNNAINGTVLIDENLNGCDAADAPAVNFMVQAINSNNFSYGTFVNATGNYDLRVQEDTYTVSPVNIPEYFTVTPESAELSFTGFGNSEALNFCLVPNQTVQDLNITVLPIDDARPGFESQYKILVENIGTQSVANATVSLTFDTTLQSFVSAVPAPTGTTNNQPTFTLTDLGVFETKEVNLTMTTFQPPVVNGGEVAAFTAVVTPDAGDNTPDDNTFVLNQTIVNSYDPNDKRVVQGQEIYMEQTDEYLDYIIRFQNSGTASAITVRIEDVLSDNLDWTTLKPIAASHAYRVEVTEGNKVNFIFNNINLPHEEANEAGSHGYIAYKIKPKQGIQLGDVIAGNAGIYFDFNLPIITNTVTTTVVEPLGVKQNAKTAVSVYPNPASTMVNIQPIQGTQVQQAAIYNLQGSELMKVSQNQNPETLNISSLSAGVYLLQVQTNTGRATYRLVKK